MKLEFLKKIAKVTNPKNFYSWILSLAHIFTHPKCLLFGLQGNPKKINFNEPKEVVLAAGSSNPTMIQDPFSGKQQQVGITVFILKFQIANVAQRLDVLFCD